MAGSKGFEPYTFRNSLFSKQAPRLASLLPIGNAYGYWTRPLELKAPWLHHAVSCVINCSSLRTVTILGYPTYQMLGKVDHGCSYCPLSGESGGTRTHVQWLNQSSPINILPCKSITLPWWIREELNHRNTIISRALYRWVTYPCFNLIRLIFAFSTK